MRRLCPALLLALLLLGACQRDDEALQWVELTAERYNGSKVAVSGDQASWVSGEQVRINGTVSTITRIDGHYYIEASAVNPNGTNRALYPATLSDGSLATDAATISLPRQYRYSASDGIQHIELPMAARSEGQSPLLFHHLTGALRFNIVNSLGTAIVLDRLTVESDRYSLSGSHTIDFSAIDATAPAAPVQDTDRTVVLVFGGQTLASGDSLQVVMPIAPVGADNHFTVSLSAHHEGTRYTFSRTQTSGGALARNQLGHAKTTLSSGTTSQGPLFGYLGSSTNPYNFTISTPEDFVLMVEAINNNWNYFNPSGQYINYNRQKYTITSNIDMTGHPISPITGWLKSTFDGGGKVISNLTINSSGTNCALFSTCQDATIQNITLKNTTLNCSGSGEKYIAPLIGELTTAVNFSMRFINCTTYNVNVNITGSATNIYCGGLIGYSNEKETFESCSTSFRPTIATNNGYIYLGGIAGRLYNASINDCHVNTSGCTLNASSYISLGGFSGHTNEKPTLTNSSWLGNDITINTSNKLYIGGVIGRCANNSVLKATSCSLHGSITTNSTSIKKGKYIGQSTVGQTITASSCDIDITVNNEAVTADFDTP